MGTAFVELQEAAGRAILGFTRADCEEIGNFVDQRVYWKGRPDVSSLAGRPMLIRIELRRAKLYAFWFAQSDALHNRPAPSTNWSKLVETADGRPIMPVVFGWPDGRDTLHLAARLVFVEELGLLIEDSQDSGVLSAKQAELVQKVFRLSGKKVKDMMVPRDKIAALELHMGHEQVLDAVRQGAHTRMPVYDGEPDNTVGIVNTKHLLYLFSLGGVVVLEDALYPALFLKPDHGVAAALELFRRSHRPMALVRDEGGKVLGLITLEDVVEEIVGDIEDEHDRPTPRLGQAAGRPGFRAASLAGGRGLHVAASGRVRRFTR